MVTFPVSNILFLFQGSTQSSFFILLAYSLNLFDIILFLLITAFPFAVTATSQARTALNMLRENRNRFDLIISDVHMPDMDGFKLLELVGLEMDLPVISKQEELELSLIYSLICDVLLLPICYY